MNVDGAPNGLSKSATQGEVAAKGTILVHTLETPQCESLGKLLRSAGYRVVFTSDVRTGLVLRPAEIRMAVFVNSWPYWRIEQICELCSAFRLAAPNLPLVVVGPDDVEAKVKLFGLGADDYVVEPFDPTEFLARISSIIRRQHSSSF